MTPTHPPTTRLFVAGNCVCNAEAFDFDTGKALPPGMAMHVEGGTVEARSPKTGQVGRLLTGVLMPSGAPIHATQRCHCGGAERRALEAYRARTN